MGDIPAPVVTASYSYIPGRQVASDVPAQVAASQIHDKLVTRSPVLIHAKTTVPETLVETRETSCAGRSSAPSVEPIPVASLPLAPPPDPEPVAALSVEQSVRNLLLSILSVTGRASLLIFASALDHLSAWPLMSLPLGRCSAQLRCQSVQAVVMLHNQQCRGI
jgi:hypothetical protein